MIVDGASFVNMNPPRHSKTYSEHCNEELTDRISNISQNIDRLDLVFDIYSAKQEYLGGKVFVRTCKYLSEFL